MTTSSFTLETDAGQVLGVRDGKLALAPAERGPRVRLGQGELRPGLINAHDHLYRNHYPRLGAPPYRSMYDWGRDVHGRFAADVARCSALTRGDALRFGALKNLIGGATTVVHHDRWHADLDDGFPVRVARVRVAHSLEFEPDLAAAVRGDDVTAPLPLCMHLAEGVDDVAAAEVATADRLGLLDGLLAVHVVRPGEDGIELLRARGAALVWCPTSNLHLYGATAPRELFETGIDVLLGTDSLLSGQGTLLDELRVARDLGRVDDERLSGAVGAVAARRLGLPEPGLEPGAPADVVLLRRPLGEARPRDVGLVLVGGAPRFGDVAFAELFASCGVPAERLVVGGVEKLVVAPLATVAERVRALGREAARVLD